MLWIEIKIRNQASYDGGLEQFDNLKTPDVLISKFRIGTWLNVLSYPGDKAHEQTSGVSKILDKRHKLV